MASTIQLIVGLGNPGPQYVDTRHNAGAWFLSEFLSQHNTELKPEKKFKGLYAKVRDGNQEYHCLFPTVFMNLSGEAVAAVAKFFKIPTEAILVAHDELDLPPGEIRLKLAGGHGGHNGLRSLISCLGSPNFARLRIGIGHPGSSHLVSNYVLNKPSKAEDQRIDQAIAEAQTVMPYALKGDFQKAMLQLHSK
jgi:PTH1 family peptidyl-tRNA hydrolase